MTGFAGLDPSDKLLDYAREAAAAKGWEADIRQGFGEDIPFADASFDTVVCTFTLCSVNDPARVRFADCKSEWIVAWAFALRAGEKGRPRLDFRGVESVAGGAPLSGCSSLRPRSALARRRRR